jgi:hypothetical protein
VPAWKLEHLPGRSFFSGSAAAQRRLWPPHSWDFYITHNDAANSVGFPLRVISSSQRILPDNKQHSKQRHIHATVGIQTHSLSRRSAVDLRLRPRGHCDRRPGLTRNVKRTYYKRKFAVTNFRVLSNLVLKYTQVTVRGIRYACHWNLIWIPRCQCY